MFDYTKAAAVLILEDFKRWSKIFKISFSAFTLLFFIYSFIRDIGNLYINIVLAALYLSYTLFEILTYKKAIKKKTKKIIARSYKWSKLLIKAFTLGSMLYGMYVAASSIDGISVILATLTIIIWVLQVLLEVIIMVVEPKVKLLTAGVLTDAKSYEGAIRLFLRKEKDWDINTDEYKKEVDILSKRVEIKDKPKRGILGLLLPKKRKAPKPIAIEEAAPEQSLPSAKK